MKSLEAHCRKIGQRARNFIRAERPRFAPRNAREPAEAFPLLQRFFEAARVGNKQDLLALLAQDSEFWSDGGGKVPAALRILDNPDKIARCFLGLARKAAVSQIRLEWTVLNRRPAALTWLQADGGDWLLETLFCFECVQDRIQRIFVLRNPDKLQGLQYSTPEGKNVQAIPGSR